MLLLYLKLNIFVTIFCFYYFQSKEMKIVRLFNKWKSSMIFFDTSRVALYFPSKSLSMLKKSPSYNNLDLNELLEMSTSNGNGLLVLKISSISLKCVVPKSQMEPYLNSTPVCFPNGFWSPGKIFKFSVYLILFLSRFSQNKTSRFNEHGQWLNCCILFE